MADGAAGRLRQRRGSAGAAWRGGGFSSVARTMIDASCAAHNRKAAQILAHGTIGSTVLVLVLPVLVLVRVLAR
jgi:hypothetical protein